MSTWNDITSTDYWTSTYGTYSGGSWTSGDFGGYQFVVLSPESWATGYSALKLRVTYSLSALALTVVGSLSFVYDASVDSGDEVDLSGIGDLTAFQFGGTETTFTVTKIEVLGEALGESDMTRFIYQDVVRDGNGKIVSGATISVYLNGTTTAASIYSASSGGTAANSTTSSTDGSFSFYVDNTDYDADQLFKIVISKTGYTSSTLDDIHIFPYIRTVYA